MRVLKNSAFLVAMRSGETPVPIPNTMVKTWAADGTALETVWESRWPPKQKKKKNWFHQWLEIKRDFSFWWLMKEAVRCTLKIAYKEKYLMKIRELNKIQQDIRGNVNNIITNKLLPTHVTLYMCRWETTRVSCQLVMLIRAYGGCLGTKSRWKTW